MSSTGKNASYYDWDRGLLDKLHKSERDHTQTFIEHFNMNFAMGNIFKAVIRQLIGGSHSDYIRDLEKIAWYAERERARVVKINTPVTHPPITTIGDVIIQRGKHEG